MMKIKVISEYWVGDKKYMPGEFVEGLTKKQVEAGVKAGKLIAFGKIDDVESEVDDGENA